MINLEVSECIAKITLSKPPINVFDIDDLKKLDETLKKISNTSDIKIITIESDQKVFSAGVNIKDHTSESAEEMIKTFHEVFYTMLDLDIPTVSLVRSGCFGGGTEIALFCDFVLASDKACFSNPEIKLGCFPPVTIAKISEGNKKGLEFVLTGNKISAKEAHEMGLVNHLFKDEEFTDKCDKFIKSITSNSLSVVKTTLRAFKDINYPNMKDKIKKAEDFYLNKLVNLNDYKEGIQSFIEKRPPEWVNY